MFFYLSNLRCLMNIMRTMAVIIKSIIRTICAYNPTDSATIFHALPMNAPNPIRAVFQIMLPTVV